MANVNPDKDEEKENKDELEANTDGIHGKTNADNDDIVNQLRIFGFDDSEIITARCAANNKNDVNEIVNLIYAQKEAQENMAIKQESEMIKQQQALRRLMSFGFDEELASNALQTANNDLDVAVQHLTDAHANENLFYNDLAIDDSHTLIVLKNLTQNQAKYDRQVLNYTFALSYDAKYDEVQELKSDQVSRANGFNIYQFEEFAAVHFIIPFCNAPLINIYVQFNKDYDFIVFKRFNLNPHHSGNTNNKIDYLLCLLETYRFLYTIQTPTDFFNKINIKLDSKDILRIKNSNKLLHFAPVWRKADGKNVSSQLVINRLVEQLNIIQLSAEIQQLSSKYVLSPFDENEAECKLTKGYVKKVRNDVPFSIIELIYFYFQYGIIRGNDLGIVNAKEKVLTTAGVAEFGQFAYIIMATPLRAGICKLTVRAVVAAQPSFSIGIISNPDANVAAPNKCIFDDKSCGDSYQMYLSNGEIYSYDNAIYHIKDGKALNQQIVPVAKKSLNETGATIEMEVDFIAGQLTFFFNFEKCGQVSIPPNVAYYAAFTYDCNNNAFDKEGPVKYEYSLNVAGNQNTISTEKYEGKYDEKTSDEVFIESDDDEKAQLNLSMKLQRLVSFGYDEELAFNALQRKNNDLEEAVQFLTDSNPADSAFYNDLVLCENKLILLTGNNKISDTEVLGYNFAMSYNQKLNENQKITAEQVVSCDDCVVYEFNKIEDVHFIIPFEANPTRINIYIQFAAKYDFILFKQFNIYYGAIDDSHFNKIDYLLSVLELFRAKIKDSTAFFDKINIKVEQKDVSVIRKNKKLFHFSPVWRKQDGPSVSNKFVVNRLAEELNLENEFCAEIETLSANVVSLPFEENEDSDGCKLTFGYIREMEQLLSLSVPIPFSLMKLIYLYFQYCIIRGNNLAIIDPKEKILTTAGAAGNQFAFIRISEQLMRGKYKFSIKYIVAAYSAVSIGVISNADVSIATHDFLFNHFECGDSYQMYVTGSGAGQQFSTAIFHYNAGINVEADKQQISQDTINKKGSVIEVEIDFNTLSVQFFFNFERCGFPMLIQPDTAYCAAFAYGCNNGGFVTEGPPKYEYSFNIH